MIIKTPKISFSINKLKTWDTHKKQLESYPIFKSYFSNILKSNIEKFDNPLAILWLRQLFDNKLNYLENLLSSLEQKNPNLIKNKFVKELNNNFFNEIEFIKKILSLNGELLTYRCLLGKFDKVEPMDEIGDFLCNDNIIVSVKSKNTAYFNSFLIGEYIHGLLFLEDYADLKNFDYSFTENDGIWDSFRNAIIKFLKNDLVNLINQLPEPKSEFDCNPINNHYNYNGYLKVQAEKYMTNNQCKIEFILTYKNKTFKMKLKKKLDENIIDINGVKVDYPDEEKYILINIETSIDNWIKDFDKKSKKQIDKKFWGWINIPLTYSSENAFKKQQKEIQNILQEKCSKKDYKIIFNFYPYFCFNIKVPIMFMYN